MQNHFHQMSLQNTRGNTLPLLASCFLGIFVLFCGCQQARQTFSKPDFKVGALALRAENSVEDFYSKELNLTNELRYSPVMVFANKKKVRFDLIDYYFSAVPFEHTKADFKAHAQLPAILKFPQHFLATAQQIR